ncbi:MAG: phage holin family protein [Bacillota bacterium]|jgi:putative membrane protein
MKNKFWWRVVVNAAALYVISRWLVAGLVFRSQVSILLAGLVLGVVNALIRPLFIILSLPFNLLSLGLFTLVINGFMLTITAWLVPGFAIIGFGTATWSAILLSLFGVLVNALIGDNRG